MPEPRPADLARLRPELGALSAYAVADARGLIKLDAMENPHGWPPEAVRGWLERLAGAPLNRYPDPAAPALKGLLARTSDLPEGMELLLGNGSDELIQILLMALAPDATVMAPEPTFVMYRQISQSLGLRFVGVPLREADFGLDAERFLAEIAAHDPALVFLAYPNNPTGNHFDPAVIERVLAATTGLVVVDEAYAPFAADSFLPRLSHHGHLLVMRTLSKLGLAGIRLGYLAGHPAWIRELEKLRLPYNINVLTQLTAEYALARPELFAPQVADILRERDRLHRALAALPGVRVYPSHANFLLLRLARHPAGAIHAGLRAAGILIKNLDPQGGALRQCLRVTVGTIEENDRFLAAFAALVTAG